jgi:hypothetical protein
LLANPHKKSGKKKKKKSYTMPSSANQPATSDAHGFANCHPQLEHSLKLSEFCFLMFL